MKKSDLYREWARVLDMCEGTGISTKNAWKFEGRFIGSDTPVFIEGHDGYEFAIAILEGKPVFVGDKLYLEGNIPYEVTNNTNPLWLLSRHSTQKEPKKTFMLNGVELPCPDAEDGYPGYSLDILHDRFHKFYFKNKSDEIKVAEAIIKLLEEASK